MKKFLPVFLSLVLCFSLALAACAKPKEDKTFSIKIKGGEALNFSGLDFYKADDFGETEKFHQASPEELSKLPGLLKNLEERDPGEALASIPSSESLLLTFKTAQDDQTLYLYDEEPMADGFYYYTLSGPRTRVLRSKENLIPPLKKLIGQEEKISSPFQDTKGHWAEKAIVRAYKEGSLQGLNAKEFGPDLPLSRAMLVQALFQKNKGQVQSTDPLPFKDLPKDPWYEKALTWAYEGDIISGDEEGNFQPDKTVSREEFALILYRYTDYLGNIHQDKEAKSYEDQKEISPWAEKAVRVMTLEGYLKGDLDNHFRPKDPLTRGELAQVFLKKDL